MRVPRIGLMALSAVLAVATAGCTTTPGGGPSGTTTKISIATQPWLGYGPWYIAADQGYFAEAGLDVTLKDFEADADMLAALAAGQVDALNVASHGALQMREADVAAKIVLLEDASTSADAILTNGTLKSVKELKGQQVAYEEGSTSDLLLNYALSEAGLTAADIVKVPMGAADAGSALIAGRVAAAVTYEPYISQAKTANPGLAVIYEASAKEGLISDVLMVGDAFAAQHPEAIRALIKAWDKAVSYYKANPTEGRAIIAKGVGADPAELATAFDGVEFFSLADNLDLLTGEYATSTLPAIQQVAVTAGIIQGTTEPAAAIDAQYLK